MIWCKNDIVNPHTNYPSDIGAQSNQGDRAYAAILSVNK